MMKISLSGELRRADARLLEGLFFPAEYQLTGAVPEEKAAPNCSGRLFLSESSGRDAAVLPQGACLAEGGCNIAQRLVIRMYSNSAAWPSGPW
mgnify:FL=1